MAPKVSKKRVHEQQDQKQDGGTRKRLKVTRKDCLLDAKSVLMLSHENSSCLLFLKAKQVISVLGKLELTVLHGSVHSMGHNLTTLSGKQRLYSSCSSSLITMQENGGTHLLPACNTGDLKERIKELLKEENKEVVKNAARRGGKASSVLLMKKLDTVETEFVNSFDEFKTIFTHGISQDGSQSSEETSLLGFKLFDTSDETYKTFKVPDKWDPVSRDILSSVSYSQTNSTNYPIVLACGGKDVGKSSFCRYLLNTLLNSCESVFVLECDVGQSEFTPPSLVSLNQITQPIFGPPYTHLRQPLRSCFFGDVSPRDNPDFYIRCIYNVFQHYDLNCRHKGPLIINTQGWIKGLGVPLLVDIIRLADPSHIVQLNSASQQSNNNLPILNQENLLSIPGWTSQSLSAIERIDDNRSQDDERPVIYQLDSVHSADNKESSLYIIAQDIRVISILSYFSNIHKSNFQNCFNEGCKWTPQSLSHWQPYRVPWNSVAIHVLHAQVDWSQILYSFNATVVGLAVAEPHQTSHENDLPGMLRESPLLNCLGLGIVRNIDVKKKCFYILTPVELSELKKVNVLLKGNLEIPTVLWTQGRTMQPYITSEFSYDIRGSGARKMRFNLMRRKFNSPNHQTQANKINTS